MAIAPGTRLGPYEITAQIGEGGMGVVYSAMDTNLKRAVALKVLPPALATDAERMARFQREAEVLASLSHPNVAIIHGLHRSDAPPESEGPATPALVMELVEGPTLAERLARGALPVAETIGIASQIADALEAAHDQGIVHRDLKPANVKVRPDGVVKVLDFGLAKALAPAGESTDAGATQSPTITTPAHLRQGSGGQAMTQAGVVLGTAAYMSPEQARGRPVDERSDVWAFGAVLYEMLTGTRAFHGEDVADTMASVLAREPDWTLLPRGLSPTLQTYLRRCLQKDPRQRVRHIADVRLALQGAFEVPPTGVTGARRGRLVLGAVALVGLAALLLLWLDPFGRDRPDATALGVASVSRLTTDPDLEIQPAISPDGRFVVYAAGTGDRMRLFLRTVDGDRTIRLTEDAADDEQQPRWSPDASRILFLSGGRALTVSALGGAASVLAATAGNPVVSAAWSPDGQEVAIVREDSIAILPVGDGPERRVPGPPELRSCAWSPATARLACVSGNSLYNEPGSTFGNLAPSAIVLVDLADGTSTDLVADGAMNQSPAWSGDGRAVFYVSNAQGTPDIFALAVDDDATPIGEPRRITTGSNVHSFSMSADRSRMAYSVYSAESNVWSLPVPPSGPVGLGGARQLTFGRQIVESTRLTMDGEWLLYDSDVAGDPDIWRVPVGGGTPERLTTEPLSQFAPDLSPDGRELAYHAFVDGSREVFVRTLGGSGATQLTSDPVASESYPRWSPDGASLVYWDQRSQGQRGLYLTRRDTDGHWSMPEFLVPADQAGSYSSDGRRIAYVRDNTIELLTLGTGETSVVHDPGADVTVQEPHWADDDSMLYVKQRDARGTGILAVPIAGGPVQELVRFDDPRRTSNRSNLVGDGRRFYFTLEDRQSDIWLAEIRAE